MTNILIGLAIVLFITGVALLLCYTSNVKDITKDTIVYIACAIIILCAVVSGITSNKAANMEKVLNDAFVLIEAEGTSIYYDKDDFSVIYNNVEG